MPGRDPADQAQSGDGAAFVLWLAGQLGQPQQGERGARGAGGNRRVVQLLAPRDQYLAINGRREEPAMLGVCEARDHLIGELDGVPEPALLAGRLEQRDHRFEQMRMVLEIGADLGVPVVVGAEQAPVLVAQLGEDEPGPGAG